MAWNTARTIWRVNGCVPGMRCACWRRISAMCAPRSPIWPLCAAWQSKRQRAQTPICCRAMWCPMRRSRVAVLAAPPCKPLTALPTTGTPPPPTRAMAWGALKTSGPFCARCGWTPRASRAHFSPMWSLPAAPIPWIFGWRTALPNARAGRASPASWCLRCTICGRCRPSSWGACRPNTLSSCCARRQKTMPTNMRMRW